MVAEPDAQGGAQDHSVTGIGAICTTSSRGVDRGPRSVALPTSAHLAHFRHQSQGAISRSSQARPRLAPERMADSANSYPTSPSHRVAAATGWHTPESRLNAFGSASAGAPLRCSLQENAFCATLQDSLFAHWDDVARKRHFPKKTRPLVEELKRVFPKAIIGGTGSGSASHLEEIGVSGFEQDYSLYPRYAFSIGFTQRGCRVTVSFLRNFTLGRKGKVKPAQSIYEIWRGDPWPRNLVLLDNDFFGQTGWRDHISEIVAGDFKVSFTQGINVRVIDEEIAAAVAGVQYYDHEFRTRRIYTAWDNRKDEARLFRGLDLLVKAGVRPDQIMVYMLIGYWPGETHDDRDYRRQRLREFGARPYPMPYVRTPELVGYQRWVVRRADLKCSWQEYARARYRPEDVRQYSARLPLFEGTFGLDYCIEEGETEIGITSILSSTPGCLPRWFTL